MAELIHRRELLRRVALLLGGAISAPAALAVLNGLDTQAAASNSGFLTRARLDVVAEIAEIMIPRTDTPGAKDVGVPAFIDSLLANVYPSEHQQRYLLGLADFESAALALNDRGFLAMDTRARVEMVRETLVSSLQGDHRAPPPWAQRPFILMTRELTLLGFFTSEAGATQVLQYDPVPGPFEACLELTQAGNGKTWATAMSLPF